MAITGGCAVVYLANQYALFGPVNADGTFTVSGIPSGTYALAFLGCDTGQPSATVHDPVDPARTYQAQWWHGVDLSLAGTTEGGPDPIAQHATLLRSAPASSSPATTSASAANRRRPSPPRPRRRRRRPTHRPRRRRCHRVDRRR